MVRCAFVAISFLACRADVPLPTESLEPLGIEEAFASEGFVIGEGGFFFMDGSTCCLPGATCTGANPATPFASFALPIAPGQTVGNPDPEPTHLPFHLRADEAVVYLGTPPDVPYFSFRSYVWQRSTDASPVFGQLGPSVHTLNAPVPGAPFALVLTMDAEVEARVTEALRAAGWADEDIRYDRIPAGDPTLGLRPGITSDADQFSMIVRVAVDADVQSLGDVLTDPGQVYRVTPIPTEMPTALHPAQPLPERRVIGDESALANALDALEQAIRSEYTLPAEVRVSEEQDIALFECLDETMGCFGASADAQDRALEPFVLPFLDFVVVYGVNHVAAGRATYANVTVEEAESRFGVADRDSAELLGTAAHFNADLGGADPDLFYAYIVARNCARAVHAGRPCMEIQPNCPGVAAEATMRLRWRTYLDPATQTAPAVGALLADRALYFRGTP